MGWDVGERRGIRAPCVLLGCALIGAAAAGCLDDRTDVPPVVSVHAVASIVDVPQGTSTVIAFQVLDSSGRGVDGADVTIARTDSTRVAFSDGDVTDDARTVRTSTHDAGGVVAAGVAGVRVRALDVAPVGETIVIATVRVPTPHPDDALTARTTVRVTASDAGAGADGAAEASAEAEGGAAR